MSRQQLIRKAIIPVGGLGTRFLPATKAQPKEMLAIVDKPVIQYIVEEAVSSGITDIIMITGQHKRAIEDHFDRNVELELRLKQDGKIKQLEEIRKLTELANIAYVRQTEPRGDGHAILRAKSFINEEPCVVLFGDDIIDAPIPVAKQMMSVYEKYRDPIIAVKTVPTDQVSMYGIVEGKQIEERVWQVTNLIEKPKPHQTPSRLGIAGKYIITPETLTALSGAKPSHHGEIRLIDGFRKLLKTRPVYAYAFEGTRYDCGNKVEFLKAVITFGLRHEETAKELRR